MVKIKKQRIQCSVDIDVEQHTKKYKIGTTTLGNLIILEYKINIP